MTMMEEKQAYILAEKLNNEDDGSFSYRVEPCGKWFVVGVWDVVKEGELSPYLVGYL